MFGVSLSEFFIIWVVAILVIPSKHWPDVARFVAKTVKFIRSCVWKISDMSEKIQQQIELEKPIDDLIRTTTKDVLDDFSVPMKKKRRKGRAEK